VVKENFKRKERQVCSCHPGKRRFREKRILRQAIQYHTRNNVGEKMRSETGTVDEYGETLQGKERMPLQLFGR
jgi:hypothetical protein